MCRNLPKAVYHSNSQRTPFLSEATNLEKWLEPVWHDERRLELKEWRKAALLVAEALASIHSRRVVHSDVHPGNIMIANQFPPYRPSGCECEDYAVFIDFEGSFLAIPTGDARAVRNHQWRAPERDVALYVPTEQVDVYSFGKVMMYLATGQDSDVIAIGPGLRGYDRRDFVRKKLMEYNPSLVQNDPRVLDIIARCTAYDSASRPRMSEVVKALQQIDRCKTPVTIASLKDRLSTLGETLSRNIAKSTLGDAVEDRTHDLILRLVGSKIEELEDLVASSPTDQIQIEGTRDKLLDNMSVLFESLQPGDSWTAFTTPDVWGRLRAWVRWTLSFGYGTGRTGRRFSTEVLRHFGGRARRAMVEVVRRLTFSFACSVPARPCRSH